MSDTTDQINLWVNAAKAVADLKAAENDIEEHGIASPNPQRYRFGEMMINHAKAKSALDKALAATGTIPPDGGSEATKPIVEQGLRENAAKIKPELAETLRRQGFLVQQAQTAAQTDPGKSNRQRQTTFEPDQQRTLRVILNSGSPDVSKPASTGTTVPVASPTVADRPGYTTPTGPDALRVSPSSGTPQAIIAPENSKTPVEANHRPPSAIHTAPVTPVSLPSGRSPVPVPHEYADRRGNDFRPGSRPPIPGEVPILLAYDDGRIIQPTTPTSPTTPTTTEPPRTPKPKTAPIPVRNPIADSSAVRGSVVTVGITLATDLANGRIDRETAKKVAVQSAPAALETLGNLASHGSQTLAQTAPKLARTLGMAAPILKRGAQIPAKVAIPLQVVAIATPGVIRGVKEIRTGNTEQGLKTFADTATTTTLAVSGGYAGAKVGAAIMTPVAGKVCIPVAIATTPVGGGICGTVLIGSGGIIGAFGGSWLGAKLANWLNKPAEKPNPNNMMNGITGYQGNSFAFK